MHSIFIAIENDDKNDFERVLNEIDNVNNIVFETLAGTILHIKQTPLHVAAILGRVEFVKQLLEKGANIYAPDSEGRPPLFTAIININYYMRENPSIADNYRQIFKMILKHEPKFRKENPDYQDEDLLWNRINEEGEKILNKLINRVDDKITRRNLRAILKRIIKEQEFEYAASNEILINTGSEKIRTADEFSTQSDGTAINGSKCQHSADLQPKESAASSWLSFTSWKPLSLPFLTQLFSCSISKENNYVPLPDESDEVKMIAPKKTL